MDYAAVIVAGGVGRRMKSTLPKQFHKIYGREIISYTVSAFDKCELISKIIIVCSPDYKELCSDIIKSDSHRCIIEIVSGGKTRQSSVYNGLMHAGDCKYVLIHDAVRCCIETDDIYKICEEVKKSGSCALGVRVKDTIKLSDKDGNIIKTVDRENLWQIQTPQAFVTDEIIDAHSIAQRDGFFGTDDASLMERCESRVKIIEGKYSNIKITTPSDIDVAGVLIGKSDI